MKSVKNIGAAVLAVIKPIFIIITMLILASILGDIIGGGTLKSILTVGFFIISLIYVFTRPGNVLKGSAVKDDEKVIDDRLDKFVDGPKDTDKEG